MRKYFILLLIFLIVSCGRQGTKQGEEIITVSIAPFKYFVDEIGGGDFAVNIMVPPGADPHLYEPVPEQIIKLSKSVGYISNGYMGFEMTWLDRFYETNRKMKRLMLGEKINLISSDHHDRGTMEGVDPHYWVSPKSGLIMASSVKDFLCELNPSQSEKYESNFRDLTKKINNLDLKAEQLFSGVKNRSFMVFHPDLTYLARDYGLEEIAIESEGKEPSPARMKYLIDLARAKKLKTIFAQREFDTRNAKTIAGQVGAKIEIIDPLSGDWLTTTSDIITAVYNSLTESSK
jgi:zinc transport system substrate-binding protein